MRFYLLFIVLLVSVSVSAQETQQDSIRMYFKQIERLIDNKQDYPEIFSEPEHLLLQKAKASGVEKVELLLQLYVSYMYKSIETAKTLNDEALLLSQSIGFKDGELRTKYNQAYLVFINGDFDESMKIVINTEQEADKLSYPESYADFKTLKSYIYTERGEYDLALETGLKLLDEAEKSTNSYLLMKACFSLSHYYLRMESYSTALSYCLRGLEQIIKLKKFYYVYPKIDEIARMTAKLNNTQGALEAYDFFLEVERKAGPVGSFIQSIVYMNMADIYMHNQNLDKAQEFLATAQQMNYENKYKFRIPRAWILQAELFLLSKDTTNAIHCYEESLDAAEAIDAFDVVKSNSFILAELYKQQKQSAKVYEYTNLYNAIRDSLFNNEKEQKIIILETRRKVKEVTQMKKILELENEAQRNKLKLIAIILIFISMSATGMTYSYFKVKAKNKLLYRRTVELAAMQSEKPLLKKTAPPVKEASPSKTQASKKNQAIDDDLKDMILHRLDKLEQDNFFLNPNCNLHEVATQLKTNSKYLSQVINQEKESNFNNYINELRINYLVAKLWKEPEFRENKLSYMAISVGFNNLNTFTAAFKKRLGIVPSYFIKELNKESNPD